MCGQTGAAFMRNLCAVRPGAAFQADGDVSGVEQAASDNVVAGASPFSVEADKSATTDARDANTRGAGSEH